MNEDASPPPGSITIERHGAVWVFSFRGEHDVSSAVYTHELLEDARLQAEVIVVDLTAVTFLDTTLMRVLFQAYSADIPFRVRFVVAPHTQPHDVFTATRLDAVLPIYERLEDALADVELG